MPWKYLRITRRRTRDTLFPEREDKGTRRLSRFEPPYYYGNTAQWELRASTDLLPHYAVLPYITVIDAEA